MLVPSRLTRLSAFFTALLVAVALIGFTAPTANAAGNTAVWTGATGLDWGDPGNWQDGAPAAGDDLVFPADAVRKQTSNSEVGVTYGSITIEGSGYDIAGHPLNLTGGVTATYTSGTSEIAVPLTLGTGEVEVASGGTLNLSGELQGTAGLTNSGGGTVRLGTGNHTYTGMTIVSSGTLQVDGTLSSAVVTEGGSLTGSGTLNGLFYSGPASMSPGTTGGAGRLTYTPGSNLSLSPNSTLHVDLDGPTAATEYDQLRLTSGSALFNPNGATLDVDLGYIPTVGTSFQIVTQDSQTSVTGRFAGLPQAGTLTSGPVTFRANYLDTGVTLTVIAVYLPTVTWDGGGATNNWTYGLNWSTDIAPSPGSALIFPAGSTKKTSSNDFPVGTTFESITIGEAGYQISGRQLVLTKGLRAPFDGRGALSSVYTPLVLTPDTTFDLAKGAAVTLNGTISGSAGITKTGAGHLQVENNNTYTGTTQVVAGTLAVNKNAALGSSTPGDGTTVADGATLLVLHSTADIREPIQVTGTGADGAGGLYGSIGSNVFHSVTMTGDTTIGVRAGATLSLPTTLGESGGAAHLTKSGPGVLNIGATAAHTGGTTVTAGTLAAAGTLPGAIEVKSGAVLSGAGGLAGDVTVAGGTYTAGLSSSPFASTVETLTLNAASTFQAQLNGATVGDGVSGHSRLYVLDSANLGDATLTATPSGYTPQPGETLTIVRPSKKVTGTFKNLPEGATTTLAGDLYRVSYQGGDGNDVTLTAVNSTTTTLTATPNQPETGQEVTLAAAVSPSAASGTVTFKDGAVNLGTATVSDGSATFVTTALSRGAHSITATYGGDATHAPSTSAPVTVGVVDSPPDTVIGLGPVSGSTNNPIGAEFTFGSPNTDVVSYECRLDGGAFAACASPVSFSGLAGGSHTFEVRAKDAGANVDLTPATRTWSVTGVFAVTGDVSIEGTAKVGQTLTAVSTVTTVPAATSTTGQWYRGQTAIDGATGTTYKLTNADVSHEITYRQTDTRASYEPSVTTTDPTATVTGGIINLGVPTISGTPVVDGVLTATVATPEPATASVTFEWLVNGVSTGVTGDTMYVAPADAGKTISVKASATLADYDQTSTTSEPTAKVAEAVFQTGPTATISGVFQVGEVLTADEGTTDPAAGRYTYQWFAGDTAIVGATSRTFTVGAAQKGQSVSVAVTATRPGYVSATDTSDRSPIVVTNRAPGLNLSGGPGVRLGQARTLSWSSEDATSVTASGSWSGTKAVSGSETVQPSSTGTHTYQLTATNGSGTTTAQVVVEVALPAAKLKLKARGEVKSGRKLTISTTGLAPREAYTVHIGGVKVTAGKATASGKVTRSVRVPSKVKAGKRLVRVTGSASDRTGTRHVKVTKQENAKVTLSSSSVRASDDQRVTVRNLRPSEKVKVTYQGKRVSPKSARANAKGVYTLTFDVGTSWGRKTVTVKGAKSSTSTSKHFEVVNRCKSGSFFCR